MKPTIGIIDHYDSFTYNLVDWFASGGVAVKRVDFDDAAGMVMLEQGGYPIVLSPGPKTPQDAGPTLELMGRHIGKRPFLGICLGHQMIGQMAGMTLRRSKAPFHGSTDLFEVKKRCLLLENLPGEFQGACYHSLVLDKQAIPQGVDIILESSRGEVAGIQWHVPNGVTAYGIQFHPESFMSIGLEILRDNWLSMA